MNKIKRGTLKTRSMEIKMKRLMYMYGVVFLNLLYKSILEKVTQGNRPLFPEVVVNLFLWYDKWTITSESVDELIVLRRKKGFWTSRCLLIGKQHPGMPDVQIIHHLLDQNTILVTSDRPFHNRVLSKRLKSYYVSEKTITDKPLKGIKSKPVIQLNKNDLVLKDSYHQPKTEIRSLLLPSSSRHLKKLYTRRRRIRNYFDGQDHLERISAAVSWKSMGTEILVGLRVRVSSNVGIKALDASENYIAESVKPEYRNIVALCYALVQVIRLMLHSVETVVYYDAAVIHDPIKQISKDIDETFQFFFNELAGSFKHLEFVPVSKGKHIEKLRAKLDQLIREKKKTNEIVPGNIWEILDKFEAEGFFNFAARLSSLLNVS